MSAQDLRLVESTHYEAFASKPPAGSAFEFLVECARILDSDPSPPLGLDPVVISDDMPADVQA